MNKNAIKNFAVTARVTLIQAVTQKAFEYEITADGKNDPAQESVNGQTLTAAERSQRAQLIERIRANGFVQTMEEAAYTWFNRFIALRFMEVNNYLPSHVRIFSDENGSFKPEVLTDAVNLEIDGLDKALVLELLENQENERLYQYIIITQCNALHEGLPEMFEHIGGWTELLFPKNLLREDSIIAHMVEDIPEEDWQDQVQIIGWLYQYYNTEPKDKVFANLKKNVKISAADIPAATQLFTPDWIVRYMVENSLGRLWTEGHGKPEHADWKYYLEEAEQEDTVRAELKQLREAYREIQPEQIRIIDPCMGSSGMNAVLSDYVKKNFPDSKSDLFACFMEKCGQLVKRNGLYAMITQHAWMFLSSYEKLREKLKMNSIVNMAHLGARAFDEIGGEVVQTTAFVSCGRRVVDFKGTYVRLVDIVGEREKEAEYRSGNHRYTAKQENFSKIPGSPVAYWVSENFVRAFENENLYKYSISPSQNVTGNNSKFVRKFWELKKQCVNKKDSWIFYAKGGGYRKWWGNLTEVVDWSPNARKIYQYGDGKHASQIINENYWYKKGITWGLITSSLPSFRIMPEGATFDKGGSTVIVNENIYNFSIGLLNSKVYLYIAIVLNPTLNFQVKDICLAPIKVEKKERVDKLVAENIELSKVDWDSFETSWDFERHPLI